ncbi:MAG TPA: hypothetical protein DCK98_07890 [Chloroflexi bacterium]|nr:hypothetical protein [Chloroflexota bacterium]HAL28774.1 hypothetical protein [Chloroflexota bacterium]
MTLDGFAVRLRDEIDFDALRDELIGAVGETLQPTHASLWLRRHTDRGLVRPSSDDRLRADAEMAVKRAGRKGSNGLPRPSEDGLAVPRSNTRVSHVIEHLCATPEHQIAHDVADPLVKHAGTWGYCPAGLSDAHDWRETGGKTLTTVREWLGRPDGVLPGLGQGLVPLLTTSAALRERPLPTP